jgi:nucleotide-binding universal stress UspA family protein
MLQVVRAWQPAEPDRLPGIPNRDDGSLEARSEIGRLVTEVLGDRIEIDVEADAIRGPAVPVLLEAADNAWLLVLGDRGRGGFAGLPLGSVSLHCAMHAGCSVVVVKEVRERR